MHRVVSNRAGLQQRSDRGCGEAQVSRAEPPAPAGGGRYAGDAAAPAPSWTARLRALLCCFRPDAGEYARGGEAEAVVIRPPQPPTPPRFSGDAVIGPLGPGDRGRKTLVLDLDETLVHSSFKPIPAPDYVIPARPAPGGPPGRRARRSRGAAMSHVSAPLAPLRPFVARPGVRMQFAAWELLDRMRLR